MDHGPLKPLALQQSFERAGDGKLPPERLAQPSAIDFGRHPVAQVVGKAPGTAKGQGHAFAGQRRGDHRRIPDPPKARRVHPMLVATKLGAAIR